MGTDKRERQKQARRERLEHQARAERQAAIRRRVVIFGGLFIVLAVGLYTLTSGEDGDEVVDATDTTAVEDPTATTSTTNAEPREFVYGSGECAPEGGADDRRVSFDDAPQQCIDPQSDYRATLDTTMGEIVIDLATDQAPGTVNNFVNLARWNYYDGVIFHRVVPGFVVQGGDPEGTGTGGPGYRIADELPDSVDAYVEGSVAMANSGPDTNGSQFFIYFGPNPLPGPDFSLFGQVTPDTLDVARRILEVETDEGDKPIDDVVINDVTIEQVG